jgi:hypothetical protein
LKVEPKTTIGKIVAILVLAIIAIAPVSIVIFSGIAEFKWSVAWVLVLVFLLVFLMAASLSVFGIDFAFTTKDQDDLFVKKLEPFFMFLEKMQKVILILVLVAIGYFYLKTTYGT